MDRSIFKSNRKRLFALVYKAAGSEACRRLDLVPLERYSSIFHTIQLEEASLLYRAFRWDEETAFWSEVNIKILSFLTRKVCYVLKFKSKTDKNWSIVDYYTSKEKAETAKIHFITKQIFSNKQESITEEDIVKFLYSAYEWNIEEIEIK